VVSVETRAIPSDDAGATLPIRRRSRQFIPITSAYD
jgi:hypothetical protein